MLQVALYQPEIPPNTGNIIRLCANAGSQLHLIHPLGFAPDNKKLQRAGLDYHDWTRLHHHQDYTSFQAAQPAGRLLALSTHGTNIYSDFQFELSDILLFGPETRGLPREVLDSIGESHILRIPMIPPARSLNLSNAVAVVLYEAWRQVNFHGV